MISRRRGKAKVIGSAGRSAAAMQRHALLSTYRQVPRVHLAVGALLLVALCSAAASSLGSAVGPVALTTALVLLGIDAVLRRPGVVATILVLIGFTFVSGSLGLLYSIPTNGGVVDVVGGYSTIMVTAVLVALIAHRTSRGRPWLTTALALLAVTFVGPVLLLVAPSLGFLWAYVAAGVVLFLRAGGWFWLTDRGLHLTEKTPDGRRILSMSKAEKSAWDKGADGERKTARLLNDLPAGFTVMHDLALPGTEANADHLVIGPTGVFLIDTKAYSGVIREHPEMGVEVNGKPLAETFDTVLFERNRVAEELGLRPEQIQAVVCVHEAVLPSSRFRVAIYGTDGDTSGEVVVVAPETLLGEINNGMLLHEPRRSKALVARARLRLVSATAQGVKPKTKRPVSRTPKATNASVLDNDGKPHHREPVIAKSQPEPLFRSTDVDVHYPVGQRVGIVTDQGLFTGYRVVDDAVTPGSDGCATVLLCPESEWQRAQRERREPKSAWYPAASVVSDQAV